MNRLITFFDVLYLRWALRKLDPLSRDVPEVFAQLNARRPL